MRWIALFAALFCIGCHGVETKAEVSYSSKYEPKKETDEAKVTFSVSRKW